jgi:hypothetical protein
MECGLMGHKFHRGFTAAEKTELSERWKRGESLKAIGRAFGKPSSSIYFLVAPHGGIRPALPRRSRLALTLAEREVRTKMPRRELIGQNIVNWRTVRGYGELWRGSSDSIGRPSR